MAQRFTFERAFPETPGRHVPLETKEPTLTVSEHQSIMAAAVAAAAAQAFQDGRMEADGEETAHLARAMDSVAMHLDLVRADLDAIQARASAEALTFAHAIGRQLAGKLMDGAPFAIIEETARRIFDDLRGQPHAAVRVAPALVDAAKERLQRIARDKGFEGRLIVLGEPEIAQGDVRIEWADGGIVRDRAAAELVVGDAVSRALAAGELAAGELAAGELAAGELAAGAAAGIQASGVV
jgi:flagellar assembly protein FliH